LQPEGEPCNSDGMWPYKFRVAFEACRREAESLSCELVVEIRRAWTPNLGGLPPLEIKPFNDRLSFEMKVHYTVVGGPADALQVRRVPVSEFSGMLKDNAPAEETMTLDGAAGYPAAMVVMNELGFELFKHRNEARYQHLGRYIGALEFGVSLVSYDESSGQAVVNSRGQVWVPDTVSDSNVTYRMGLTLLQFGQGGAVVGGQDVEGSLCANSDGAPFFSAWNRCGEEETGPEQVEDAEAIDVEVTQE